MDIQPGDTLVMKKNHPCGDNKFYVIRSGADFRCKRIYGAPKQDRKQG